MSAPRARVAAALAALAAMLLLRWTLALSQLSDSVDRDYIDHGEMLLHAVEPARVSAGQHRLALATAPAAMVFSRAPAGLLPAIALAAMAASALLCGAAGAFIGGPAGALFSAGLLLGLPEVDALPFAGEVHQSAYAALVLLCAALAGWHWRRPTPGRAWLLGAAIGLSLCYRSPLALLPPLLAALRYWRRRLPRPRALELSGLCVAPYLLIAPWIAMNAWVYGRFTPFEQELASGGLVKGALGIVEAPGVGVASLLAQLYADPPAPTFGLALRLTLSHPLRAIAAGAMRLWLVFSWSPVLLGLGAAGLWRARRQPQARAAGAVAGCFLAAHALFPVEADYFAPLRLLAAALAAGLCGGPAGAAEALPRWARATFLGALAVGGVFWLGSAAATVRFASLARKTSPASERALEAALSRRPDDVWLLNELGWRLLGRGRLREARRALERALELRPGEPEAEFARELSFALAGERSPRVLERTRSIADKDEWLRFRAAAALAWMETGHPAEAERLLGRLWLWYRTDYLRGRNRLAAADRWAQSVSLNEGPERFARQLARALRPWPPQTRGRLAALAARAAGDASVIERVKEL